MERRRGRALKTREDRKKRRRGERQREGAQKASRRLKERQGANTGRPKSRLEPWGSQGLQSQRGPGDLTEMRRHAF